MVSAAVGVPVGVVISVAAGVGVAAIVLVGVMVSVAVATLVGGIGVDVAVTVAVTVGVAVAVLVGTMAVSVDVAVSVGVTVATGALPVMLGEVAALASWVGTLANMALPSSIRARAAHTLRVIARPRGRCRALTVLFLLHCLDPQPHTGDRPC
jgi:hypothetical protein